MLWILAGILSMNWLQLIIVMAGHVVRGTANTTSMNTILYEQKAKTLQDTISSAASHCPECGHTGQTTYAPSQLKDVVLSYFDHFFLLKVPRWFCPRCNEMVCVRPTQLDAVPGSSINGWSLNNSSTTKALWFSNSLLASFDSIWLASRKLSIVGFTTAFSHQWECNMPTALLEILPSRDTLRKAFGNAVIVFQVSAIRLRIMLNDDMILRAWLKLT